MNDQKTEGTKEPSQNLKPASLPVKCPLCNGWGTFSYGKKICNGCFGKGWVLVPAEKEESLK